ncbi:MAG: hypothetical protein EOP53_21215 [Sphingobacteriales bacterium]|nr:MAG: hypothetical protein EOP53_21215 [Sphingobacteriales bacterium]
MIQLFRTNKPYVFILLLLYAFGLRAGLLLFPHFIVPGADSFIGPFAVNEIKLNQIPEFYLQIADVVLIYLQAIFLNLTLTSNNVFERTYIPAFIFITLAGLFGAWQAADLQTVAQLFLLVSIFNLFQLTGKEISRENIFYTSLFLSIGSLFYFPVTLFLLIILVVLVVRLYNFFEVLLLLVGFVLPYYFIGIGFYYQDALPQYFRFLQHVVLFNPNLSPDMAYVELGMMVYLLLLIFWGYFYIRADSNFKIVKQRRLVFILLGYTALTILVAPFVSSNKLIYLQMICVPATVFISKIFDRDKVGILNQVLFYLLFFGAVFFELYYLRIV